MMKEVIKRDGRIVSFDSTKILSAVEKAMKAAGCATLQGAAAVTEAVVKDLETKYPDTPPKIEEIQDVVERELMRLGFDDAAKQYILYRANRTRIREANTSLMKTIDEITKVDARQSDVKRDNANIDGNTAMGSMLQIGTAGAKAYNEAYLLTPEQAKAYREGDIHIHDFDFYSLTTTCTQIDIINLFDGGFSTGHGFLREPQSIQSYAALAAIAIQSNQNDQHGGQSIPNFDYGMALGVAKTFRKAYTNKLMEGVEDYLDTEDEKEGIDAILKQAKEKTGFTPRLEDGAKEFDAAVAEGLTERYQIPQAKAARLVEVARHRATRKADRDTYQAMEGFVHNLNTMHSRAGAQVPFSSINFGTDTSPEGRMVSEKLMLAQEAGLGNGETPIFPILIFKVKEGINYNPGDPNYDLFKLACRVSAKRLFPNFEFLDAPFNLQYYEEGKPETEVATMGCRTRVMGNVNGPEIATGRGNNSFTSINLVRIGIKHGQVMLGEPDIDGFYAELDEKIDIVIEQLLERLAIQAKKKVKNFPFLMGQGVWLGSEELEWEDTLEEVVKQGTLTMGFIGLAECLKALIGEHHGESEYAQKMGLEIVGHMRQRMDEATEKYHLNFSLIATPAEGLSGRFTRIDKKIFGELEGITDREYYTNSFHIPVYYHIRAFDKIRLEGPYHALTNGGHISYVEVDGDPSNNLEAFEAIVRCMKENNIGYGSINHPVDRDPCCGYSGVIEGHICPKCGRDDSKSEYKFEKIRRITGYLVGTVDRFNNAKKEEESDRVKHA